MLSRSFFPNFGQGPFPKIAGKSPDTVTLNSQILGRTAYTTAMIPHVGLVKNIQTYRRLC